MFDNILHQTVARIAIMATTTNELCSELISMATQTVQWEQHEYLSAEIVNNSHDIHHR